MENHVIWIQKSSCFKLFVDGKYGLLSIQNVDVRRYFLYHRIPCFLITEKFLFWTFQGWEIRSSFNSRSWCKMTFPSAWNTIFFEHGKVLVLNFSGIGKTVFFWSKKLIESWYFLGSFELFMILQNLGNIVFRAVYSQSSFLYPFNFIVQSSTMAHPD